MFEKLAGYGSVPDAISIIPILRALNMGDGARTPTHPMIPTASRLLSVVCWYRLSGLPQREPSQSKKPVSCLNLLEDTPPFIIAGLSLPSFPFLFLVFLDFPF